MVFKERWTNSIWIPLDFGPEAFGSTNREWGARVERLEAFVRAG